MVNEVAVLLCTYNGEAFLQEQLESIVSQRYQHWRLYVSDDGSTDSTLQILRSCQRQLGDRMSILEGPRRGFARNFFSLLQHHGLAADYYAFCDQDDIWYHDKLERSVKAIESFRGEPALYCSRTRLIDEQGRCMGHSPLFKRPACFRNALVQSVAGANTMLINKVARELLLQVDSDVRIVAHDWLAYLVVSAAAGQVIYDPVPTLDYRQHAANLIGGNTTLRSRIHRLRFLWDGRFAQWNDANIEALAPFYEKMPSSNKSCFNLFQRARSASIFGRIHHLRQSGVYRQTSLGNLSLLLGNIIGRI